MDAKDLLKAGFLQLTDFQRPSPEPKSDGTERIDRYAILGVLGTGGMSKVYRARDLLLNREVALKRVRINEPKMAARFAREAGLLAKLSHPGIIPVFDFNCSGENAYFTMPVVDGDSLEDRRLAGNVDPTVAARIVRDAAEAMHYAHGMGVLHRDLKPSNILIDTFDRVLVMDFGLGWIEHAEDRESNRMTATGAFMGTPYYASPEQARGDWKHVDPTSDIYSLGVTLYETLAGRPPFEGATVVEIIQKILKDDPAPLRKLRPDLPWELEVICQRALEKERARRYPSMKEFADDLGRYIAGEPIRASRPGIGYRARRTFTRHKTAVLAILAIGLVTATVVTVRGVRRSRVLRDEFHTARRLEGEGNFEAARDVYRSINDHPESAVALKRINGEIQRREARRKETGALLESGRNTLENSVRFFYSAESDMKILRSKVEEALEILKGATELAPEHAPAHEQLGYAWELLGWDDLAEESYRKAITLDPRFPGPRFRLGRILLIRSYLATTIFSGRNGNTAQVEAEKLAKEARSEIEASSRFGSPDPFMHDLAATLLAYARQDGAATTRLAVAGIDKFRGTPGVEEFHWMLAVMEPAPELSLEHLGKVLAIRPKHALALLVRADVRKRLKDPAGALDDLTRALDIHPRLWRAYHCRGNIRRDQFEWDKAISDYSKAIDIKPDVAQPYSDRSMLYSKRGKIDLAMEDCNSALRIDPSNVAAFCNRAVIRLQKHETEAALADLAEAIRLDPVFPDPYYTRGTVRINIRDLDGAISDLTEFIRQKPLEPTGWHVRAIAYSEKGMFDESIADLEEALRVAAPGWPLRLEVKQSLQKVKDAKQKKERPDGR